MRNRILSDRWDKTGYIRYMNKGDRKSKRYGYPSSKNRAEQIYRIVEANPGISKYDLCKILTGRSGISDAILSTCEGHGYLIAEDPNGSLYPFKIIGEQCDL